MTEALKNREEQHCILLPNASWETYERLLVEREERRTPRFFYDRGVLEISSPSTEHDGIRGCADRRVANVSMGDEEPI